ncbi:hypothetical protein [Nonomuraea sp. NPDC049480]|uniref:hypothetical protein n=1 Tax=Nonomuraea sp. NPDC049480 TaxID=3364353 RepID=UPI0037970853
MRTRLPLGGRTSLLGVREAAFPDGGTALAAHVLAALRTAPPDARDDGGPGARP